LFVFKVNLRICNKKYEKKYLFIKIGSHSNFVFLSDPIVLIRARAQYCRFPDVYDLCSCSSDQCVFFLCSGVQHRKCLQSLKFKCVFSMKIGCGFSFFVQIYPCTPSPEGKHDYNLR
jgi:hypothetical protein